MRGERRVVTVVVAEVSGHDELATALDPEDAVAASNGLIQLLQEAVHRQGGEYSLVGNAAVHAFFGLRAVREDDALRAARAACGMQSHATLYADDLSRETGVRPEVRIGLHTGMVATGASADMTAADASLATQTLDHARILASLAPEGGILASHDTYRATRRQFKYLAHPADRPAYLLVGAKVRSSFEERFEGPLIGREAEVGAIAAGLATISEGIPTLIVIQGGAGVGKTRLTRDAVRRFGGVVLDATRSESFDETRLLGMVRALIGSEPDVPSLENALGEAGVEGAATESLILADYLCLSHSQKGPDLAPKARRERSLELICRLLWARAALEPTLLVAGDLGSADEAFLAWLEALARLLSWRSEEALPLAIIAECRTDSAAPLPDGLPRPAVRTVAVGPLGTEDSMRLAASLLGLRADPTHWPAGLPGLLRNLQGRAEGNPLFVEEIVRGMEARGVLVRDDKGAWRISGLPEELALPSTLAGLVSSRLELLPDAPRRTLQVAAVLGRTFDRSFLEEVSRQPETGEALATLVAAGFLVPLEGERFGFAESLAWEVAYESLLEGQRDTLHLRAGQALERVNGPDDILARHFERAGERSKAARYHFRAGDRAFRSYANARAQQALRAALAIAQDLAGATEPHAWQILPLLGEVEMALGNTNEALRCWRELRAIGDNSQQIRALRELGKIEEERRAAYDAATCYLEMALARARALGLQGEEGAILGAMGTVAFRRGSHAQAVQFTEGALAAPGERSAHDEGLLRSVLGLARARLGDIEPAIDQLVRSLALRQAARDEEGVLRSLNSIGAVHLEAGRLDDAEGFLLQALSLARKLADRARLAMVLNNLGEVRKWRGDFTLAARHFEEIVSIYRQADNKRGEGLALANLGEALLALGDVTTGRECVETAFRIFEEIGYREQHTQVLVLLAESLGAEGSLQKARETLAEARRYAGDRGGILHEALVNRGDGILLIRSGNPGQAIPHLERGISLFERLGLNFEVARTRRLLDEAHQVVG